MSGLLLINKLRFSEEGRKWQAYFGGKLEQLVTCFWSQCDLIFIHNYLLEIMKGRRSALVYGIELKQYVVVGIGL